MDNLAVSLDGNLLTPTDVGDYIDALADKRWLTVQHDGNATKVYPVSFSHLVFCRPDNVIDDPTNDTYISHFLNATKRVYDFFQSRNIKFDFSGTLLAGAITAKLQVS